MTTKLKAPYSVGAVLEDISTLEQYLVTDVTEEHTEVYHTTMHKYAFIDNYSMRTKFKFMTNIYGSTW